MISKLSIDDMSNNIYISIYMHVNANSFAIEFLKFGILWPIATRPKRGVLEEILQRVNKEVTSQGNYYIHIYTLAITYNNFSEL